MDSKLASRKLGYGFSTQHQEISLTDFVVNAKKELEAVPVFDPWRHIAVEKKVKRFLDNESQKMQQITKNHILKNIRKLYKNIFKKLVFTDQKLMVILVKEHVRL